VPGASITVHNPSGTVRLVSAKLAAGSAASLTAGLDFRLNPGWHIYWRTAGDAGYPPRIVWDGSTNIGTPVLSWPVPKRFISGNLQDFGYDGHILLPLTVPITHPGRPVHAVAALDYLACSNICVPMRARLTLDLPAGPASPSPFFHTISRFEALVPGNGARVGLRVLSVKAVGPKADGALRVIVAANPPLTHPDMFVEAPAIATFLAPSVRLEEGGARAVLTAPVAQGSLLKAPAGQKMIVTVADGPRAMQATVTPVAAPGEAAPAGGGGASPRLPAVSLLAMLATALLGGLILNLMPCVLPVLSIKVLGAVGHGGKERGHVRVAFLASAAGIVVSFLILAGAAIGLKEAGRVVGWGIQFQQPGFIATMAALLALFAANLWGFFEIPMPSWLVSGGQGRVPHHTVLGHFLTGALATLLATPCSAPFLGTAIGFALARGPFDIVAIFAALGVGMAAPFLAVAVWPGAATRLPRPGPWMAVLKKLLGFALAGTAIWLLWVLASLSGLTAAILSGGALALAVAVLGLRGRAPARFGMATIATAVLLTAAALAVPFLSGLTRSGADAAGTGGGIPWVRFDRAAIAGDVAAGKVVFVDVGADWCITCQVNKRAVIEQGAVARRLAGPGIVPMLADWTRPDDAIARYLASYDRFGIPFSAVYGPGAPDGIVLPELLTSQAVLDALDRAEKKGPAGTS
jgi:suppressor for copper-sensitivity B